MLKKIFLSIVLSLGLILLILNRPYEEDVLETRLEPEKPPAGNRLDLESNEQIFRVHWIIVSAASIKLYSNLEEGLSSRDAKESLNCKALTSAGFYTKEKKPLGFFVSEGKLIQDKVNHNLYNGIFSISPDDTPLISRAQPEEVRVAVQSGPILMENGKISSLILEQDKRARRIIVATTDNEDVVFLVIYDPKSAYLGPQLSELPQLTQTVREKLGLKLSSALNLDGGTASAFHADSVSLGELAPVGSFFCIKTSQDK